MRSRRTYSPAILASALALVLASASPTVAADDSLLEYRRGSRLDQAEAVELEARLQKRPNDWKARAALLGYWTRSDGGDGAAVRAARARHLLWLIENRPQATVLAHVQAASFNLKGHRLADPAAYNAAKELWSAHLSNPRASRTILFHAAVFFGRQDPTYAYELASRVLPGDREHRGLRGEICAAAYIGALGVDHTSEFALWLDPDLPASPLAEECKKLAQNGDDRDFLRTFVVKAARDGSDFYMAGELNWDYAAFLKEPAAKALAADTEAPLLRVIPGIDLPDPADAGPRIVSIGGDEMQMRRLESYPPVFPDLERRQHITGSAHLLVTISPEGEVIHVNPVAGRPGFQAAAKDAVVRWKYQGLEHRGQPYFVLTYVQVHFSLRPGGP